MSSIQIKVIVQDSLTEMIDNYKNSSTEFRKSVDQLQMDVSTV